MIVSSDNNVNAAPARLFFPLSKIIEVC